ncbi:hypothetical protein JKP88DRAFT_285865 [Tribonema minus]|uniref:Peptidase M48 domain-containing protein n=1 Tax=Tribonema minus TaxID=303371 RepID=A0A835ZCN7_9STRA|nr:hypothetical protein JKP88DRAFT_285865 [Tribonema minus]
MSRKMELEADAVAMVLLARSGVYQPTACIAMLERFKALAAQRDLELPVAQGKLGKAVLQKCDTHPPMDERIAAAKARLPELQALTERRGGHGSDMTDIIM